MQDTYSWQLLDTDTILTDEMGEPVTATPARRGAHIFYPNSGEKAARLSHDNIVYIDHLEHDILIGDDNIYVRLRPDNFYNY